VWRQKLIWWYVRPRSDGQGPGQRCNRSCALRFGVVRWLPSSCPNTPSFDSTPWLNSGTRLFRALGGDTGTVEKLKLGGMLER
jgi:hypothetical protein